MSSTKFEDVNPLHYFALYPDRIVELKTNYDKAVSDALKAQKVTFYGAIMDVAYVKNLLDALENSDLLETAKTINNLYGVDDDKELMDMFEGRRDLVHPLVGHKKDNSKDGSDH